MFYILLKSQNHLLSVSTPHGYAARIVYKIETGFLQR